MRRLGGLALGPLIAVRLGIGAGGRDRTCDSLLGKQALCQLSYSRSGARSGHEPGASEAIMSDNVDIVFALREVVDFVVFATRGLANGA